MSRVTLILLGALLALAGNPAAAQDPGATARPELFELDIELGLEHSDNRARTSPRGDSATALVPRAVVDWYRAGDRVTLRLAGYADQRWTLQGSGEDDLQVNLAGRLNWHLVDERLSWIVENVASGAPLDLAAQDTRENRQQTNVFSTGPRWVLQPARPWSGLFDLRYVHSHAEDSDAFDSHRWLLAARAVRRLDGGRQLSAGAEWTEVNYRNEAFAESDYQRVDLVGRYQTVRDALEMDIAVGRSRIDLDRGERLEGNLVRFRLAWSPDERYRLVASAGHELSDSVRQLAAGIEQIDLPMAGNRQLQVGNEYYVLDYLGLGWRTQRGLFDLALNLAWRDYQFELDPLLDIEEHALDLGLTWRLDPTMAIESRFGLERRRFREVDQRDTDARLSLFLLRRFNPRWSGRVGAVRYQRDSNIVGQNSRENIVAVYLTYHAGR